MFLNPMSHVAQSIVLVEQIPLVANPVQPIPSGKCSWSSNVEEKLNSVVASTPQSLVTLKNKKVIFKQQPLGLDQALSTISGESIYVAG